MVTNNYKWPIIYITELIRDEEPYDFDFYFSTIDEIKTFNDKNPLQDAGYKHDMEDLLKIQYAIFKKTNQILTVDKCAEMWQQYSYNLCASWLFTSETPEAIIQNLESDDHQNEYKTFSQSLTMM